MKIQCKNLPDQLIIELVAWQTRSGPWTNYWSLHEALGGEDVVPFQVVRAKINQLDKRNLVHGCHATSRVPCGGQLHIPRDDPERGCWC